MTTGPTSAPDAGDRPRRAGDRLGRAVRGRLARARDERAIAVVWMAMTLLVMVLFAGFAVDLSNWYYRAERVQRAADAGAHAGVVFLPADLGSATTRAKGEVALNGYPEGARTSIAVTQEPNPNRLRVKVRTTVDNYFLSIIGLDTQVIERDAVAEYVAPVPMGSPENKLGNDPARGQNTPQLWVNIAGPNANKVSGDRFQAKVCASSTAGCTGTANAGIDNDDYSFEGYIFALKVRNVVAGQPLQVQVYDPAMTYVGDKCEYNMPTQAQANALQALPGNPYPDASTRYAPGLTSWCNGDQDIGGRGTRTTFIVRRPDNTPWSDVDNPVVSGCTVTMPAFTPGQNGTPTIYQLLHPTDGQSDAQAVVNPADGANTFAELFRRNVTICTIPAGSVQTGDYILQVRSNATPAAPLAYSAAVNDGGHNRMSIQVGFGSAGLAAVNGNDVSINARGRLPIYANATGASTNFYLARVLPYDAGRTLRVNLYDISDVGDSGTMQVVPPAERGGTFSGCAFSNDTNLSMSYSASTCTLTVPNGRYNARNVVVDIPIPSNYTCNDTQPTGCWITVRAAFNGPVQDTTTWSASILGNPIRLVE